MNDRTGRTVWIGAVAVATMIGSAITASAVVGEAASASSTPASLVLSGRVLDSAGHPSAVRGVWLSALDWRAGSRAASALPLGHTDTDRAGNFRLSTADLASAKAKRLRALSRAGGHVELEIAADTPSGIVVHDFVATLPDPGARSGARASLPGLTVEGNAVQDGLVLRAGSGLVRGPAGLATSPAQRTSAGTPRSAATDHARAASGYTCVGVIQWQNLNQYTRRWVLDQKMSTLGRSNAGYAWDDTTKTQLGIAVTGAYGDYSGGLGYSNDQDYSTGVYGSIGHRATKALMLHWKFRRQRAYCDAAGVNGGSWQMNLYKWVPWEFTGGNELVKTTENFRCVSGNREPTMAHVWVARSTTTKVDGSYGISGVSLSVEQTNSNSHKLEYWPSGSRRAWLCGSTDSPAKAKHVREVTGPA